MIFASDKKAGRGRVELACRGQGGEHRLLLLLLLLISDYLLLTLLLATMLFVVKLSGICSCASAILISCSLLHYAGRAEDAVPSIKVLVG
jgi:hypothetical protein